MGNLVSACDSSTKGFRVRISRKVDYIDSISHEQKCSALDQGAVHGQTMSKKEGAKEKDCLSGLTKKLVCSDVGDSGDEDALQIVQNAMRMAEACARQPEMKDSQWREKNGQNTLWNLLGARNVEELKDTIIHLASSLEELVAEENAVNYVSVPAKVYGDLHGQFYDMLLLLHYYGWPSKSGQFGHSVNYVFNGDWVDRGAHQLETICLVYALKLAFPDTVWLNRGNHEDINMNQQSAEEGFEHACLQDLGPRWGTDVFNSFVSSYGYLPLATVLGENILVLHGGIGDGKWHLKDLECTPKPIEIDPEANNVVYNVLWSDPVDEDRPDSMGVHDNTARDDRHYVWKFGADITKYFCYHNELGMIIRSHQFLEGGDGYECMHDEHLMRVFSARDYSNGNGQNDGSILSITVSGGRMVVRPQMLQSLGKLAAHQQQRHMRGNAV